MMKPNNKQAWIDQVMNSVYQLPEADLNQHVKNIIVNRTKEKSSRDIDFPVLHRWSLAAVIVLLFCLNTMYIYQNIFPASAINATQTSIQEEISLTNYYNY